MTISKAQPADEPPKPGRQLARPQPRHAARKPACAVLLMLPVLAYCVVLVRTAWLCDDAFISFRTIDNLLHGDGLRWNVGERVQSFTHPLWLLLLAAASALSGELYYTSLLVSGLASLAAVALLIRVAPAPASAALGVLALLLSKAFVDFSTGGLENPLTHLLLGLFLLLHLRADRSPAALRLTTLVAALGAVNRLDTLLLFLPALTQRALALPGRRAIAALAQGLLPLVLWEVFAVVYFGFPFPNTAYAKLKTGIAPDVLAWQGLQYLLDSFQRDPLSLSLILLGLIVGLGSSGSPRSAALGILLYLVYVVRIGGDFMSGRFLTAPFYLAVVLLAQWPGLRPRPGALLVLLLGLASGRPTVLSSADFGTAEAIYTRPPNEPIADERWEYFQRTGLLRVWRGGGQFPLVGRTPFRERHRPRRVLVGGGIGIWGYFSGPSAHILDLHGLADPLLARLPTMPVRDWRIGHFRRELPPGYLPTVASGRNQIEDPGLAAYYDELRKIVAGPLFTRERWIAIWNMNTGASESLLAAPASR